MLRMVRVQNTVNKRVGRVCWVFLITWVSSKYARAETWLLGASGRRMHREI
jgi:hypothetical protein